MRFSEFRLAMAKTVLRLDHYPDVLSAFETARSLQETELGMTGLHSSFEAAFRLWTPKSERYAKTLTPLPEPVELSDASMRLAAAISTLHDGHYEILRIRYERELFPLTPMDVERLLLGCLLAYIERAAHPQAFQT